MLNKDYKLALEQIEQQLENDQYAEAWENIQWLKGLKPVPLILNALEAKYHLAQGDYQTGLKCLDHKWKADYAYDGLADALQAYEELWHKLGDEREASRYQYMRSVVQYMETDTEAWQKCLEHQRRMEVLGQEFYETGDDEILQKISDIAYIMSDAIWYTVIQQYFHIREMPDLKVPNGDWMDVLPNMGWIKEQLEQTGRYIIIVAEERNVNSCKAMARIFAEMEKYVYLIKPPTLWELGEDIVMAQESFRLEQQDVNGIREVPSFYLEAGKGQRLDNRGAIIGSLLRLEQLEDLALIISSGNLANDLELEVILKKQYSRFNLGLGDLFESNFSVGWAGDYCKYISTIYDHDVDEWLRRKPTCRYSIVIPVRNSAECLRHTLQTCLEVNYPRGEYEIVISDNSTDHNKDVYQLCESFNDARIKYYRTPRELPLAKSFEFAFLQTRGEFIFSIGADDAVLPWALQVLDDIRERYPNEKVIHWPRGFYVWKENCSLQRNQLVIPAKYETGVYGEEYVTRMEYLKRVLEDPQSMYTLPTLYINSGCRRDYMRHILQETGRLWDGMSQDIYMGVINILLNGQILYVNYPLAIAGMASVSIGINSMRPKIEAAQTVQFPDENMKKASNAGNYCPSMTERLIPDFGGSDNGNLYHSLLRAVARGVLSETYLANIFDWKKIFWDCAIQLNARDIEFDKLIQGARYTASWHGEAFLKWFDETIYEPIIQPTRYEEEKIDEIQSTQAYLEGETESGGIVVDASRYGVENSHDAVKLFIKLSGLGNLEGK